jgi:hypothetical protein
MSYHHRPLMSPETHSQLANFIWSICNLLRGPYKRNEYRKVILPLTVLRRFDCLLAPTKARVLEEYEKIQSRPGTVVRSLLERITGRPFFNLSRLDFAKLLDDPNQLAANLNGYISRFSPNVRAIDRAHGRERQDRDPLHGRSRFSKLGLSNSRARDLRDDPGPLALGEQSERRPASSLTAASRRAELAKQRPTELICWCSRCRSQASTCRRPCARRRHTCRRFPAGAGSLS